MTRASVIRQSLRGGGIMQYVDDKCDYGGGIGCRGDSGQGLAESHGRLSRLSRLSR